MSATIVTHRYMNARRLVKLLQKAKEQRKTVTSDNLRGQGPAWDIEPDEFDMDNDDGDAA